MNMTMTIKMPPLNLISAPDWYTLLFNFPLLANVSKCDENVNTNAIRSLYSSKETYSTHN